MSEHISIESFRKNRCNSSGDGWHKYIHTRIDKFTFQFHCKLCGQTNIYIDKEQVTMSELIITSDICPHGESSSLCEVCLLKGKANFLECKIEKQSKLIAKLKESNEFYANRKNWFDGVSTFENPTTMSRMSANDLDFIHIDNGLLGGVTYCHAGKLARKIKKEVEVLENE